MPRHCSICDHSWRAAIELDLLNGSKVRTVAKQYSVTRSAVHRHITSHPLRGWLLRVNFRNHEPAGSIAAARARFTDLDRKWQDAALILEEQSREMTVALAALDHSRFARARGEVAMIEVMRARLSDEDQRAFDHWRNTADYHSAAEWPGFHLSRIPKQRVRLSR